MWQEIWKSYGNEYCHLDKFEMYSSIHRNTLTKRWGICNFCVQTADIKSIRQNANNVITTYITIHATTIVHLKKYTVNPNSFDNVIANL